MSNVFYSPGEQRAAKVNDLFAAIARRYDLLNDIQSFGLHRRWKTRLVKLAGLQPGQHALDVCCGTGDIALALAQCGAQTIGLDFSPAMLDVARARMQKSSLPSQESGIGVPVFVQGDAMQLPFSDNSFDAVTVGYGLRNLANWERGLGEMVRVAKPGGRVVVLDFGKPTNRFCRALYYQHLKISVPLLGWLFCRNADAYAYILESLRHYPAQEGVAGKMREWKLSNLRIINLVGGAMAINYGEKPL